MANIDATQYASAMLNQLRSSKEKQSVKEITSSAKKLPMVSRYYGTSTEMLKDMFSGTKNYDDTMFAEAAKRGEAQQYLALLAENEDVQLSDEFYDTAYYDYETNLGELSLSLVDDTDKTLADRTTMVFDPTTGEYVEQSIGKMTDKQYLEYQLNQARQYRSQEIQFDLEKYRKESMDGWDKFLNSAGQVLAEAGEGLVGGVVNILDLVGALGYSVYQGVTHASGNVFENSFVEYYRNIGISSKYEPAIQATLGEWERKYGWIKNIDGSSTSVGGVLASIANSFGQMLPGIFVGALTGGASIPIMAGGKAVAKIPVGFATFYAQMYSGNMYENATNPALKDTPAGSLILNAGLKAVSQAVIEWGLGKILGGTVGNNLLGLGSRGLVQTGKAIAKGLTKGKIAAATVGFLLKSAGQEGLEEFLQDMGDMLIDTAFSLHQDGYTGGIDFQQLLDSFIVGAISSIILSGLSVGYQETTSAITKGNNKFDIFYTKDGKTKKVRGFSRLLWREMLNNYDENIEAIQNGTLSEKATVKTMQAIYATYQTLGQFFDGISEERIAKAMSLLNGYMNNQNVANERFQKAQWLKENFGTEVDPDSLVDVDKLKEIRTQAMNEYVSQLSGDVSRVLVDAKITGIAQASVKKDVKAIIEKNKEKLVDNDVTEVVRAVDKNGETVGTNDQSSIVDAKMEKYRAQQKAADTEVEDLWKKSQKTVDELSKDYDWIFTTDGHVALEDGEYLFVPEAWLENHTPAEIKEFLVQAKVVEIFQTDETFKPIYEAMVKSYKEFTGADLRKGDIRGAERVILDTLFNEAVFQHFLLKNVNNKLFTAKSGSNFLFSFAKRIEILGKQYAKDDPLKKQLLDKIYDKIKQTMRRPIMKAVINWNMNPQKSGADTILTPTDMQYIQGYKNHKRRFKEKETSAYYNLKEQIIQNMGYVPPIVKEVLEKAESSDATEVDKLNAHLILDIYDTLLYNGDIDSLRHVNNIKYVAKIVRDYLIKYQQESAQHILVEQSFVYEVSSALSNIERFVRYFGYSDINKQIDYINDLTDKYVRGYVINIKLILTALNDLSDLLDTEIKQMEEWVNIASLKRTNVHTFNIPIRCFSTSIVENIAYIQYAGDIENNFEKEFGYMPNEIYGLDWLNISLSSEQQLKLSNAMAAMGISDRKEFVRAYLEDRLGDGWTVIKMKDGVQILKCVPANKLFRPEVLAGNLANFFKYDSTGKPICKLKNLLTDEAKKALPLSILDYDITVTNIIGDEGVTQTKYSYLGGSNIPTGGTITLDSFDYITLYHEVTHAISDSYILPSGGGPNIFTNDALLTEALTYLRPAIIAAMMKSNFSVESINLANDNNYDIKKLDDIADGTIFDNTYTKKDANDVLNAIRFVLYEALYDEMQARNFNKTGKMPYGYTFDIFNGTVKSPVTGTVYHVLLNTPVKQWYTTDIKTTSEPSETYRFNTEIDFFRNVLQNKPVNTATGTYHTGFTGDSFEILNEITNDLDFATQYSLSLDEVIKNPEQYLKKEILDQIKDKSEGGVYRFLQNYFAMRGDGFNIDRDANTHEYIFVNDNSFNDVFTKEISDVVEDDGTSLVEKYSGKTVNYSTFFSKEYLAKLGLPTNIGVTIGTDVHNETVFNKEYPNGHIYIRVNQNSTNAEFANKLAHEFRHLMQHYNQLESGFTPDFNMTSELLSDIKRHFPELFTDSEIRRLLKTDARIAQEFVYYMIGGEQQAFGFDYSQVVGKPWYVAYEAGKSYLFAPWYDAKTGEGRYQVKIANRMADETKASTPKGHKLTERGTVTSYKGKGKRVTIKSEVTGKPSIKVNKKTGEKTIIPVTRDTVVYKYSGKNVRLSEKRATKIINGKVSNLHYFYKKGGDNYMSPELQDFIEATTGHEATLPKQLVQAIKQAKLTKQELFRWFRTVDLKGEEFTDTAFELLNKYFFHNPNIHSKEELDILGNTNIGYWFAAYAVLKDKKVSAEWFTRANQSPEAFVKFIESFKDSSFKKQFEKYYKSFTEKLKELSHGQDEELVRYMRPLVMKLYDGTLQSAIKIANNYLYFARNYFERVFNKSKGISLDSTGTRQDTRASHAGENKDDANLEEVISSEKGASSGSEISPLGGSIITELYDTNAEGISIDDARKVLVENDYESNYKESAEKLINILSSKKSSIEQRQSAYKALRNLLQTSYLETVTAIKNADSTDIDAKSFGKAVESQLRESLKTFDDSVKSYLKGNGKINKITDSFYNFIVETRTIIYNLLSDEEINQRYDILTVNDVVADDKVEVDVTQTKPMFSRRNTQSYVISLGSRISNMIADGKIAFNTLPQSVRDMFIKETSGEHTVKAVRYVLKKELYQSDKTKRGTERYDTLRETAAILQEVVNQAKRNVYQNTQTAAEMRKNLAAIERSNRRKQREQANTEKKLVETVYNYKKKVKSEGVKKVKNAPVRTEVNVIIGSEIELPGKLNQLFATGFEGMADTEVQFASQDAEGKLYEKGDKEFESRLQHEIVSWDIFYEYNREILSELTRDDVIDIVEAIQKGIWAMGDLDAQRKVLAFQIFIMGYILSGARNNVMRWNLSDAEVDSIRGTYERLASIAGTGLNSVKQMLDTINPLRKVQQEMLEDWDIDPEQSQPLFDAITSFTNAETDETRIKASEEVVRQLGIIEGLMKQHQLGSKLDRKADKERQKALRDKWQGDLDQYKAAEARWKKLKAEGNDKQAGTRPKRPDKPKALRVNILDNPLYKGLMNWRYTAMLSNPATWLRNIVSNVMVKGINKASDAVSNVVFDIAKKGYRADQWDLSGRTKVSEDVNTFVDNLVNSIMYTDKKGKDKRLFDLLYEGTSKYSDRMKLKTGADLFSALVVQAVEAKYAATHRFNKDALNRVANFVSDRIKDTRFIKSAANKYFKKILQIEVNNGKIDLSKPISRETLDLFAEAVILASQDFMHKESALGAIMSTWREKHPNTYAVANIFFPFLNASFNWFTEGFKLSPFGLGKAIWNSAHLEKMITDIDERRAKGEVLPSTKAVQYLVRRDVGKGIIGTILWGLGAILAAVGWIRIEEEDDKPYVYIGDIKLDIGDIFGSSSLLVGAAIVGVASRDEATFDDVLGTTFNLLLDGFIGKDLWETSRWNNNMYEFMLSYTESFMKSFMPQMVQLIVRATNNHNITYSSGILGSIQRWLNSFVPTQFLGDKRVNPYTGELETKYAIPFLGEILKSGLLGIRIVWKDISAGEILAKEYGVNKNPIDAEITINGVKTSLGDKNQLNQYYGKLNANSLAEIQNERHLVEMPDGSFETLSWKQMTDDQRKNVIERTFTKNATYAKVYMWTQVLNRKYYTNNETRKILRELGITSNVYLGDKGYVE